jgi:4-hydroxy-tetrahydrodipicolinate synthase
MGFAISGVWSAAATPLDADLKPDLPRLVAHGKGLLAAGCDGIALLGTTGEANSFSVRQRKTIVEGMLQGGLAAEQLAPGVGVAAIDETVELTRHALDLGITRVVMLPPFYYKNVSDDGVFVAYSRIIEAVGDDRLKVVLYNFPQTSAVPLSADLVARLIAAFPGVVAGIKDSSGKLESALGFVGLDRDFAVMIGSDPLLLQMLPAGAAGCITALSNLQAADLRVVYDGWNDPARADAVAAAQDRLERWRTLTLSFGAQLPTIKAMLAMRSGDEGWNRLVPPLVPLKPEQRAELTTKLREMGETV